MSRELEMEIIKKGEEIFEKMEGKGGSIFNKDWWYGRVMDWSMKNEQFKTQMFRFVDVLPTLESSGEVAQHLKEYFEEPSGNMPSIFNFGVGLGSLAPSLLAGAARKNITQMAKMFIVGENPKEAIPKLKKSRKENMTFTADLLGEAVVSEKESEEYQARYIELIDGLSKEARTWPENPLLDQDNLGSIPKVNVSIKLTTLFSQIKPQAWEYSKQKIKERLRPIIDLGIQRNVFINIDMESYSHKSMTVEIFKEILMEDNYKNYPHFGIVVQAYLKDSYDDVLDLIEFSKNRKQIFSVRLVKGAYWDYETIVADDKCWPVPVFEDKYETDHNYEKCAQVLIDNHNYIKLALGSHNVRSLAAALTYAEKRGLPKNAIEIQMLFGMAEPIKRAMIKLGYRMREYAPVGELIPGMAYLVRRLLENTSNESFLRSKFSDNMTSTELLKDPYERIRKNQKGTDEPDFKNQPILDFTISKNREKMALALKSVKDQFGKRYPIKINGNSVSSNSTIESINPSNPSQVIGVIDSATKENALEAIESLKSGFKKWRRVPATERARLIRKVADLIERDRYQLSAIEIFESGKPWAEADGDITEAIDFCRYYAMDMEKLAKPMRVGHVKGEISNYEYTPRGVNVVIAPWNFPLAILTGMVTSSLVTGNTVIMKPAEQSSIVAARLYDLLIEAGIPNDVVSFLPGIGEEIGPVLSNHKDVSTILFTGSRSVGLSLIESSSKIPEGQIGLKKCIAEMGGKNAMIIDSDADLDEAVQGVVYSAFGFAGQKCSACSRVIVLESIYDRFIERLSAAIKSLKVGSSDNPRVFLGPVIDKESYERITTTINLAAKVSKLHIQSEEPEEEGYFVPPTLFIDVDPNSNLAQEEIFGPVLAAIKAKDLDQALEIANSIEYGLTAGIFSRSPQNIEKFKVEIEAGNVYVNRTITGALVERHPFGGIKFSGVGAKTGSPDYLKQLMNTRCLTENTLRRGFAPEEK